jgi:hypothetical protein
MFDHNGNELKIGDYVKFRAWDDISILFDKFGIVAEFDPEYPKECAPSAEDQIIINDLYGKRIAAKFSKNVQKLSDEEAMLCLLEN